MTNKTSSTARQIVESAQSNGTLTPEDIKNLRVCLDNDWIIDQTEAELLFKLNQTLGSTYTQPGWTDLFVQSLVKLVLFDMETPGEIGSVEGDWLDNMLNLYAVGSPAEVAMTKKLTLEATTIQGAFAERLRKEA
ncbi:hypothetical protein OAE21_02245 [Rubripirellula sp.]|nr:hypothetical protein [Rubripirellula sp.]MDB4624872.1 hypothetical protein [Rubripirellula sp.]